MKQKGDFSERRVAGFINDALVPLLTRNIYLRPRLNPVKLWVVWKLSHSAEMLKPASRDHVTSHYLFYFSSEKYLKKKTE